MQCKIKQAKEEKLSFSVQDAEWKKKYSNKDGKAWGKIYNAAFVFDMPPYSFILCDENNLLCAGFFFYIFIFIFKKFIKIIVSDKSLN